MLQNMGMVTGKRTKAKKDTQELYAKLTPKQRRFVMERAKDPEASNAEIARRAGYSDVGEGATQRGYENVRKSEIANALAATQLREVKALDMSRDAHLKRLHEHASHAAELGQLAAAVRAEELCGKIAGLYIERSETVNLNIQLASMSPDDVRTLMSRISDRLQRELASPQIIDAEKPSDNNEVS